MSIDVMIGTQRCGVCEETLPLDRFQRAKPDKGNRLGLEGRCKSCKLAQQRMRRRAPSYEQRSEEARRGNLWHLYKITLEEYNEKLAAQNGVCAICGKPPRFYRAGKLLPLSVDHDHTTGENRDLLCGPCNALFGMAQEDHQVLTAAMDYGKKWGVL